MNDTLPLDPAGDHWLGADRRLHTRAPRSALYAALVQHLEVKEERALLGGLELGTWDGRAWRPGTALTALEVRFLADRGHPHPARATEAFRVRTDLHTHFAGCVSGADLVQIGRAHGIVYPRALLAEVGCGAEADLPLAGMPEELAAQLARALELPLDAQCTHQDMDRVYRLRRPITKHLPAFPALCRRIAEDYAAMGVEYAELSLFDVLEPAVLAAAHACMPQIRADTGVDLRFLAAFSRHDDLEWDLDMLERLRAFAPSPLLVGVDFMGHETNSTREFVPHLRAVAAFAREHRPDFTVRVHAGENPVFPENVPVAVEALLAEGARVRIGHGLYGVDDDMLARMAARGVVVEFNLDSNFALNNVRDALSVPLARYAAAGAPIVLGTDGYGIYRGDARAQARAAQLTGLAGTARLAAAEDALLDARRDADRRLAGAFAVPAAPAPRHFTPALEARRAGERRAAQAALRARATLADPAELDRRFAGRRWVSIAGAWRNAWPALDAATRERIEAVLDELVAGLANAVLITGGTVHGVEGRVHAAARRHGVPVIGALVEATPPADVDELAAHTLVGRTLYDKPAGLYRLLAERGGHALFFDGGNIVHDEIRIVANLRLPRLFFAGVPGASGVAALRWPRHAFATAAHALARLDGRPLHAERAGGRYYYRGPNPSADVVCLRRHPSPEVLLIRRRHDVGAEAGRWALPGGFVRSRAARDSAWTEDLETPAAAALRELAEETHLELAWMAPALRPIGVYEGGGRDPRDSAERWSRSHAFRLDLPDHLALATLLAGDDAEDVRWFPLDALPPLAFDHARIVADARIS